MKNSSLLLIAIVSIFLLASCTKENLDITNSEDGFFIPTVDTFDLINSVGFAFTTAVPNNTFAEGGSSALGTNITSESINSQFKWTLFSRVEDGSSVVEKSIVFYTDDTDAGTYPVDEFHFNSPNNDIHWTAQDMTGDITVSELGDTPGHVDGSIFLERISGDTTFTFSANLTEVIILD